VRLAERGVVAPLVLPLGMVVVPYLVGVLSVTTTPTRHNLALLPGLYLAFIGRIVLKDFRDVHGDAMFGKWTFLLRHGPRVTCVFSAVCWVGGVGALVAALPAMSVGLGLVFGAYVACALHGLAALARCRDRIAQQVIIGAIAQSGRAVCITALAQLTLVQRDWLPQSQALVLAALAGVFVHSYLAMFAQQDRVVALQPY
jgi:4-hydroxybenzoate polyprenyltransferase